MLSFGLMQYTDGPCDISSVMYSPSSHSVLMKKFTRSQQVSERATYCRNLLVQCSTLWKHTLTSISGTFWNVMGVAHFSNHLASIFAICGPWWTISGQDKVTVTVIDDMIPYIGSLSTTFQIQTVIQICLNGECIIRQMLMWSATDDEPHCGVMPTDQTWWW